MAQTFLPIFECVGNTAVVAEPGCYVVTAVTGDGETPFCDAICVGQQGSSIPPLFPTPDLDCVNYYLVDRDFSTSNFTWDPYPDALGYNVYTSPVTDPDNYTLDRINIPLSVLPIADANVKVTAITQYGETPHCPAITFSAHCGEVDEWLARIAANGGITPPIEEQFAVCDFVSALKDWGLWDLIYAITYFSPNGRQTAETWLKPGPFSDVWTWSAPAGAQTFTVNGIDNVGLMSQTTVLPTDLFTTTDCGISGYVGHDVLLSAPNNRGVTGTFVGSWGSGGTLHLHPYAGEPVITGGAHIDPVFGFTWGGCWVYGSPRISAAQRLPAQIAHDGAGFVSLNRLGVQNCSVYYGASDSPISAPLINLNSLAWSGGIASAPMQIFGGQFGDTHRFRGVCSMLAFHKGLAQSQVATLFNIVQTLRMALGGGYV